TPVPQTQPAARPSRAVRLNLDVTGSRTVATFVAWLHPPLTSSPTRCRTLRGRIDAKRYSNIASTLGARHCSTSTDRPQRTIGQEIWRNAKIVASCPYVRFAEHNRSPDVIMFDVIKRRRYVTSPARSRSHLDGRVRVHRR